MKKWYEKMWCVGDMIIDYAQNGDITVQMIIKDHLTQIDVVCHQISLTNHH